MQVMKFGGASLRDGPAIERSLGIVGAHASERPVVVVSAQEGVTAMLARAVLLWDHPIPIVFHWVLAAFVIAVGLSHRRRLSPSR